MSALVQTTAALGAACDACRAEGILALDTEFVWSRTYRPQLGLVQMGCRAGCWALDCQVGMDVAALGALMADASVVKILHDARQDLTHLFHYTRTAPRGVFDTQLAAAFADFPAGTGLQKLLFEAIDVGLAKTETLTDWMRRPLTDAQVAYALDDVRYLPPLRDELLRRAEALGTRAWLEAEMHRYDDAAQYGDVDPATLWQRVRTGRVRLDGLGRATLRRVVARREELARTWNLPKAWLGDDGSLAEMSASGSPRRLRHRLRGGRADTLRAIYAEEIAKARAEPEDTWPEDPHRTYIPEVRAAADAALAWLDEAAAARHVAPGVVASRAVVTAWVDDALDPENPLASGWRHEAFGREMAERFAVA